MSRARRCIENVFGILAAKFRVLLGTMELIPTNADAVVKAIVCLHNFLIDESSPQRHPSLMADRDDEDNGTWRQEIEPLRQATEAIRRRGNNHTKEAAQLRENLLTYCNEIGSVPWQDKFVDF